MIEIDRMINNLFPSCKMILQVHDELVFEVPANLVDTFSKAVKNSMENIIPKMGLIVDIGVGDNWDEAH
jgi:DNA polymerase-1